MLPLGLRLAPKIFTAVAKALEWCLRQRGVTDVDHYLDDYVTIRLQQVSAKPLKHIGDM